MRTLFDYIFYKTFVFYQKHNDAMPFFMALGIIALLQFIPIVCFIVLLIKFNLFPDIDLFCFGMLFILLATMDKCHLLQDKHKIMRKFSNRSKNKPLHLYSIIYSIFVIGLFLGTAYISYYLQRQ